MGNAVKNEEVEVQKRVFEFEILIVFEEKVAKNVKSHNKEQKFERSVATMFSYCGKVHPKRS